jgi:hypothetical protein
MDYTSKTGREGGGPPWIGPALPPLPKARPDKVHMSIHFPGNAAEVRRVIGQVNALDGLGGMKTR